MRAPSGHRRADERRAITAALIIGLSFHAADTRAAETTHGSPRGQPPVATEHATRARIRPQFQTSKLRVVTFNMAMGLAFRHPISGLIRGTFRENRHVSRVDVLGLQEVCMNDRSALELLRGVMGRNHARVYEHAVLADPNGTEGCRKAQVILSRYPIRARGGFALPRVGAKRSAAWVDLDVGGIPLRVYNVHFSNRAGSDYTPLSGRWAQARAVLDHWLASRARDPELRGIILGDFNSLGNLWNPHRPEPAIALLARHMTPNMRRFVPTMWLPYKTDWIFSSGLRLRQSRVLPTVYSDHFVVVADYWL